MRSVSIVLLVLVCFSSFSVKAELPGDLDQTFGNSGVVLTAIGPGNDAAIDILEQSHGKLVAGGYAFNGVKRDFAITRYFSNGTLDTSFNGNGKFTLSIGNTRDYIYALATTKHEKVIAAGWKLGANSEIALIRVNSDGSLDTSFGNQGIVNTGAAGWNYGAYAVAVQKNHRIVVGGQAVDLSTGQYYFTLVRYLENGSLDTSFGQNGIANFPLKGGFAHGLLIEENGKILLAGHYETATGYKMAVTRFTRLGQIDSSFANQGVYVDSLENSIAYRLLPTQGNRFLAIGSATESGRQKFAAYRFHSNGQLDTQFGNQGVTLVSVGDQFDNAGGAAIGCDGKITLAGQSFDSATSWRFGVARLHANGAIDTDFGNGGARQISVGAEYGYGENVLITKSGKPVVVGFARNGVNFSDFALIRLIR